MFVSDIIQAVRSLIAQKNASLSQFSDSDIISAMNLAKDNLIINMDDKFQAIATIDTQPNKNEYTLPNDFLSINEVSYYTSGSNNPYSLIPIMYHDYVKMRSVFLPSFQTTAFLFGQPTRYYTRTGLDVNNVFVFVIGLFPIPTAPGKIEIYYFLRAPDVSSPNNIFPLPDLYKEAIVYATCERLMASVGDYESLVLFRNMYKEILFEVKSVVKPEVPQFVERPYVD